MTMKKLFHFNFIISHSLTKQQEASFLDDEELFLKTKNYDYNLRFVANLVVVPVSELNQSAVSLIRKMV